MNTDNLYVLIQAFSILYFITQVVTVSVKYSNQKACKVTLLFIEKDEWEVIVYIFLNIMLNVYYYKEFHFALQ